MMAFSWSSENWGLGARGARVVDLLLANDFFSAGFRRADLERALDFENFEDFFDAFFGMQKKYGQRRKYEAAKVRNVTGVYAKRRS